MSEPDFATPFTLDALAELVGDAKIVAIGENNHHIREFGELRDRVLRFLVEHHGFTVLGFESGFTEGKLVADWLHGGPGEVADIARDGFTFSLGDSDEMHEMLRWLRTNGTVHYSGLDVPSSAGSPLPALRAVRAQVETADPDAVALVDRAIVATEPYSSVSSAVAPGLYAGLDTATRDAATAALAVLASRLEALAPVYDTRIALHHAMGALRVDTYLRELDAMMSGTASAINSSSRDLYMASTVRLLRELHPGARIVLMLHNGHLQRVPLQAMPAMAITSTGSYLAKEFGDDYFALGLTAGTGATTGLEPAAGARLGFRVYEQPLGDPVEGSVERAFAGHGPSLVDLRSARGKGVAGSSSVRLAHMQSEVDVIAAFDGLVYLPEMQVSRQVAVPARIGHVNPIGGHS
jgi:erythromycin esterase